MKSVFFFAITYPCNHKQKKHDPIFACRGRRHGTPVAIAGHHCGPGPCGSESDIILKKILLELFRVKIVLNHFECLNNTLEFQSRGWNSAWKWVLNRIMIGRGAAAAAAAAVARPKLMLLYRDVRQLENLFQVGLCVVGLDEVFIMKTWVRL